MALSDVILEISHFFDETLINRLESEIVSEHFAQKYGVPSYVFATTSNKSFDKIAYKVEDAIFQENSKLNES